MLSVKGKTVTDKVDRDLLLLVQEHHGNWFKDS